MGQRRAIRRREAVKALQYAGEVVRKAPTPTDADSPFGLAGPHVDVVVRCDDGRTVTASLPIAFEKRFPVGSRIVKRSGRLWPDPADAPVQDPNDDPSV